MSEDRDEWLEIYQALLDETKLFSAFLMRFFLGKLDDPCRGVKRVETEYHSPPKITFSDHCTVSLQKSEMAKIYSNIDKVVRAHEGLLQKLKTEISTNEQKLEEIRDRIAHVLVSKSLKD